MMYHHETQQPTDTVYVIDDRMFGPIRGFEDRSRAAERLDETWRFLSEPKPGLAFPRVAAGYAFLESNRDIPHERPAPAEEDELRFELPFGSDVQVYFLASRFPGQTFRLPEPQIEIFRKPAGGYDMKLEENATLREFLVAQSLEAGETYGPLCRVRIAPMEIRTVHAAHLDAIHQAAITQGLKCTAAIEAAIDSQSSMFAFSQPSARAMTP